ncbi:helix-turn-helix transcriptional regulator [Peristeroidobacter soli]|uniref:helix-turn-helix transcriptional regulator n=1 Tax=Peristeroidobacter soli TaxID=2497877 RepID=UPI00101D6B32|nr:helix-turn-helix transcriptional regulator [Peristeroidobacter soli]
MGAIHELGHALRARRTDMGLSQAQVAALSGLSRQTVNQIETGAAPDLGLNKAERLAGVLGLVLRVDAGRPGSSKAAKMSALARAAATASVSFRRRLARPALERILASGELPEKYIPHVHALLDDAPVSLLGAVAEQLHDEAKLSREAVWKNYRNLARQVKSRRDIWG